MNTKTEKILFITSSRIGDAILSSGVLSYIEAEHPNAKVTIACAPLVVSLFEGYPQLERIIPLKKKKHNKHWIELWKQVIGTKWDIVIDIRNSAVSRLIFAKKRYIYGGHIRKNQHKVEQVAATIKQNPVPQPNFWPAPDQQAKAETLIPDSKGTIIGMCPTSNWIGKTWPTDRFIEIAHWLTAKDGICPGATIAVFGAPGEEEDAYKLYNALPEDKRLDIIAKGSPGQAAACLKRCDIYIGNDSGLMHCAAAAGVKTIGLFGPSYPHIYSPWGPHTTYARTPETFDELIDFEGYNSKTCDCLMGSLTVDAVKKVIEDFLKD